VTNRVAVVMIPDHLRVKWLPVLRAWARPTVCVSLWDFASGSWTWEFESFNFGGLA
jgi:hypothetical protein